MTDYVETFDIPGDAVYGIAREDDGNGWQMWRGGCGIGHAKTIHEAREAIHNFSYQQLQSAMSSYLRKVDEAERSLERLGLDPFHLGRFMK